MNSSNKPFRSNVEEIIIGHLEKLKEAQNLKSLDETYEHVINNWFMFDPIWLNMVVHMKEHGRLQ